MKINGHTDLNSQLGFPSAPCQLSWVVLSTCEPPLLSSSVFLVIRNVAGKHFQHNDTHLDAISLKMGPFLCITALRWP